MELKRLMQFWDSFPEVSMEERPVLSSDLEKIVVKNPLSDAFYLRKKLIVRITVIALLWLINAWQFRGQWKTNGSDLYVSGALFLLLTFALYFHIRLILFADYPTLLALPLIDFLTKLETILDKYIVAFKLVSAMAGFYLLKGIEGLLYAFSRNAYDSLIRNDWYKWLILIFLAISCDILLLHALIPRYRRLQATIGKYRDGILARAANK
ncbi:MAG TPA: hypothetical protein VHE54_18235 [Puia sp.]|nr:hypothetical protein [Puia sp.]